MNAHDSQEREGAQRPREPPCSYDREKLEERLAKLSGGVAVIRVGAPPEAEMKSRHEAFDDAIHATRAAIAEGIVLRAGLALLRTIGATEAQAARADGDERAGALILRRALEAPTRQIAENSGVDGGVVLEKMLGGKGNFGFDATTRLNGRVLLRPLVASRRWCSATGSATANRCGQPATDQQQCRRFRYDGLRRRGDVADGELRIDRADERAGAGREIDREQL